MKATLFLVIGLVGAGTPAIAASVPNQSHLSSILQYPGAPRPVYDEPRSPYAMTYVEEAARNLGVNNGRMDVFSLHSGTSSYMPSISGGLGGDCAMLRLKWHPGE